MPPHGAGRFQRRAAPRASCWPAARLRSDSVRLVETRWHGTEHRYRVELRGGAHAWAEQQAAKGSSGSWSSLRRTAAADRDRRGVGDDSPVKFLPVYRDRYRIPRTAGGAPTARQLLSTDDYHPFIRSAAIGAGTLRQGRIFVAPSWRARVPLALHERRYASRHPRPATQKMGFLARRKPTARRRPMRWDGWRPTPS